MDRLTVLPDAGAITGAAAERITSLIEAAVATRDAAVLALSGGHTPEPIYQVLADPAHPWRARIDWARVHVYWSDERNVPPDHPDSNFGLANRALLQHVPIPAPQIHRICGERPAADAGAEYDMRLRARRDQVGYPLFDVMLLGIGPDAHIASIFPESPLLVRGPKASAPHDQGHEGPPYADIKGPVYAEGVWVPKMNQSRITLTPPALLDSTAILVLAAGNEKANAMAAAINGELDVPHYPAQLLRAAGDRVEWIVDAAAAALARR